MAHNNLASLPLHEIEINTIFSCNAFLFFASFHFFLIPLQTLVRESPECRDLVEDAFHVYVNPQRFELQTVRKGEMKSGKTTERKECCENIKLYTLNLAVIPKYHLTYKFY